jgi:hypothetical protein
MRELLLILGVAFVLTYLFVLSIAYYTFMRADGLRLYHRIVTPAAVGTLVFAMILLHPGGATRTVTEYA